MLPTTQGATPLYINIEGKSTVAVKEINPYVVTAIGGPGEATGGNFTFLVSLSGNNIADALVSPGNGRNAAGVFKFNLTAPSAATDITITVNVTSESSIGQKVVGIKQYFVKSVHPITISVTLVNQGSMALEGVPVYFYADGEQLATKIVSLPVGGSKEVTYNWTESVSRGQHEIMVKLDPDQKFVRFESGGVVYTQTIWVGEGNYSNTNSIFIGGIILLMLLSYLVYKRPAKRRKK